MRYSLTKKKISFQFKKYASPLNNPQKVDKAVKNESISQSNNPLAVPQRWIKY